jgi:hypothetical protein
MTNSFEEELMANFGDADSSYWVCLIVLWGTTLVRLTGCHMDDIVDIVSSTIVSTTSLSCDRMERDIC